MGSTSISGKGTGAALNSKGPLNNRSYFVPEITPHAIAAGNSALVGGVKVITLPAELPNPKTSYAVLVTGSTLNAIYVSEKTNNVADTKMISFTVTGTGAATFGWVVLTIGYGLEVTASV